jgi:hypothetical protein
MQVLFILLPTTEPSAAPKNSATAPTPREATPACPEGAAAEVRPRTAPANCRLLVPNLRARATLARARARRMRMRDRFRAL